MALLNKSQILAAPDIQTEIVAVPEWGGDVLVRALDGAQRDQYEAEFLLFDTTGIKPTYEMDLGNARARLAALCMVDEQGARLFTDDEVTELGHKSASALDRVYSAGMRLSGLSKKDVEELQKNSKRGRKDGSNTD